MPRHNAENERVKREYEEYLRGAMGLSQASIDAAAKAIHRFEATTEFRNFRKFHIEQAKKFRRELMATKSKVTNKPLCHSTLLHTLNSLRTFFIWLAGRPGYKSKISYADAAYFRLSEKDERIARAIREQPVPTPAQIEAVLAAMPCLTDIERRNRALVAFIFLTGIRDGAVVSLKIKHVNLARSEVDLDAREVKTKFAKSFKVCLFPVGGQAHHIVEEWMVFLREVKLYSNDDPLFPATAVVNGAGRQFEAAGLSRNHWANATPIRMIFRNAFALAGLPYFNPHSFRKTIVQLGEHLCSTPEEFKAWSQNLGHEDVMVTLRSYGTIPHSRQAEIIGGLGRPNQELLDPAVVKALQQMIRGTRSGRLDS